MIKIPILMYHMVRESEDVKEKRFCCRPKAFKQQMVYLKKAGYNVVGIHELVDLTMKDIDPPEKSIAITFDDGFADNYKNAFPVLKECGFPATIFVPSRLVGKTNEWMQKKGFPRRNLLDWLALREMAASGITIGSHAATHPSLTAMEAERVRDEVANSKYELETALGNTVHFIAYPYGKYNEKVKKIVQQAGYHGACCTQPGFNSDMTDPYALRRIEVYGTDSLWEFILKLTFGTNEANVSLPLKYYCSRILFRLGIMKQESTPVLWAGFSMVTKCLAKRFPTKLPTILTLSLPRSGSSWVGEVLGSAPNALYLREPLTQSNLQAQETTRVLISVDPRNPPKKYEHLADTAFAGIPIFHKGIVKHTSDWSLLRRKTKRLVIKEVNPLATRWLLECYSVRLIFLVRHPAAVALSYSRLGWIDMNHEELLRRIRNLTDIRVKEWEQKLMHVSNFWEYQGAMQGAVLRTALESLGHYPDHKIVKYEELCANPIGKFNELFEFSGLTWNNRIEALIINRTAVDSSEPYSTSRISKNMINSWRDKISSEDLARIKEAYEIFDLPWYRYPEDW